MSNAVAYKSAQPMTPPKLKAETRKPRPGSWVWLVFAAGLLLISYGAHNVPLAAWLAPVFLLRFVREHRPLLGLGVAYLLLAATFSFQLRGMVPIPGLGYYVFLMAFGVVLILPYGLDRLLVRRLDGWAATLVFPCAWAATEYAVSLGPYGSWGSAAYSQYGNLPLLQILSVTGLWGVTFLIGWFAAVCNWAWEEGLDSKRARTGAAIYAAVLLGVLLLGGSRMAMFPPSAQTVRVASLSKDKVEPQASDTVWQHVLQNSASSAELDEFRAWANAVNGDLLSRAEREAQAGAKIVFWGETNAMVFKEDESTLITRGRDLAAKYGIYLGMAMASWHRGENPPLENKLVLIQPDGQVAWEYFKARPVPGGEAAMSIRKDGKLRSLDTPYGRMSSVICFDADFPQLLAQAGALGTDVLLDPSNDWRAIDPWHTQMASFRAIEQGFNLVRHTSLGLSAAYDYQGRRLAAMDHYLATDHTLISQVPIKGVRTLYSRWGDWFAWACLVGLVGLTGLATRRPNRQ